MTDISHHAYMAQVAIAEAAAAVQNAMTAPHMLMKPKLFPDGDMWCALYGDDLMTGVAGFGETPYKAMAEFDIAWLSVKTPAAAVALNRRALSKTGEEG